MILINAFIITIIHELSWFRLRSDTENVKREAESAKKQGGKLFRLKAKSLKNSQSTQFFIRNGNE